VTKDGKMWVSGRNHGALANCRLNRVAVAGCVNKLDEILFEKTLYATSQFISLIKLCVRMTLNSVHHSMAQD